MTKSILIRKVAEPYGWLGNMSKHPVRYKGELFRTAEALFQCLRFEDVAIRHEIVAQKSPMAAKMKAKKHRHLMVIEPQGESDVANMRTVLGLKLKQHPQIRHDLLHTSHSPIIEDCTKRPSKSGLFWGARFTNAAWQGQNMLGKLWMELRDELAQSFTVAA